MRKPRTLDPKIARKIFYRLKHFGEYPETGEAAWLCKECALKRACYLHRHRLDLGFDGCVWGWRWDV